MSRWRDFGPCLFRHGTGQVKVVLSRPVLAPLERGPQGVNDMDCEGIELEAKTIQESVNCVALGLLRTSARVRLDIPDRLIQGKLLFAVVESSKSSSSE